MLLAVPSSAAERATPPLAAQGDWIESDRRRFQSLSIVLTGPQLMAAMPSVFTFSNAALHNSQNLGWAEYKSVDQRNAYYNLLSLVFEFDPNTSTANREVRFFHAATLITLWTQIGAVDSVDNTFCAQMSEETRSFLRSVNARLFEHNVGIINKVLFVWKEPRDPTIAAPTSKLSGWDFDVLMVRYEQGIVERAIQDLKPSQTVRTQISKLDNNCALSYLGGYAARGISKSWVDDAYPSIDFFDIRHRKAIGYSLVTMFHKKSQDDFRKLLKGQ